MVKSELKKKYKKEQFKNVYFITGTATGGKTTISKAIADKYGFFRYDVDIEFDRHQKLSNHIDHPAMNKKFKNADEFFLRPKEEYIKWLLQNTQEQMEFILDELIEISENQKVVCDLYLTVEEAKQIANENQIVFLIRESNDNIIDDYCNRKSHEGFNKFINSSSNPTLAKKNCNDVLKEINEKRCNDIKSSNFLWIERNEYSTVEKTLSLVEKQFELIPDLNIFMMCDKLNNNALSQLPDGFHIRACKPEELKLWMEFPFDNEVDKKNYYEYMNEYFVDVYGNNVEEFYSRCLFVCESQTDKPVATCFVWKAYNKINTIHWFKTLKEYEGKGLGRALLSYIMYSLNDSDYSVFLHTQPASYRAIGLYSDFGFKIVTDKTIGYRKNDYEESLPILKRFMRKDMFDNLQFVEAPKIFDESAKITKKSQF